MFKDGEEPITITSSTDRFDDDFDDAFSSRINKPEQLSRDEIKPIDRNTSSIVQKKAMFCSFYFFPSHQVFFIQTNF